MTVAQLIKKLEQFPPDHQVYVDEVRCGSEETGAWTQEAEPVIYDMETYIRIAN